MSCWAGSFFRRRCSSSSAMVVGRNFLRMPLPKGHLQGHQHPMSFQEAAAEVVHS